MQTMIDKHTSFKDSPAIHETVTDWLQFGFEHNAESKAIIYNDLALTYPELEKLSNKVANFLINNKKIRKGDRIGICLDRSFEMIICLIGILKTGAAYVPLDPSYPTSRLDMMQEDAKLSLIVAHETYSDIFQNQSDSAIYWGQIENEINKYSEANPTVPIEAEDVAYVIFTSGSTGRPKGILMPHRALSNLIEWQLERDYFKKNANVLQYSSISFDVSFQEIVSTLASGGTLFLIDDKERRDPRVLLEKLKRFSIERLFMPFVALRSLIETSLSTDKLPETLKEVITAGEQLRVDDSVRSFFSNLPDAILENQYGPSETHVISAYLLDDNPSTWKDLPPIGKSIKNNSIYILDNNMKPVEEGKSGELYLAGRNVAHGYIDREDLTEKSFIRNPLNVDNRPILYKTGDLGLCNENGDIEFLGRADRQIKIRGYRVEPGEVNTAGADFPGISQCLTHAIYSNTGNAQLVTYFVAKEGFEIDSEKFKLYLAQQLPEYMVPAFIIEIENVPYTPSGKVDFKSLPKPDINIKESDKNGKVEYKSVTESKLADIWSKLLGIKHVPRTVSFFDMGGDSLRAVTLFLKIEKKFGISLPLSTLTQAPNLKELAEIIDGTNTEVDFSRFRSLQLIQKGNSDKTPLFLVHGGAGNVLMFKDLAKGLDSNQPIYAFQWSGWDGYSGEEEITEMANSYKKELQQLYPSGPYRLGGHCIGGIIAIKIAQLLKEEGAYVIDPLLVTDAPNLHSKYYHSMEPEDEKENYDAFKSFEKKFISKIPEKVTSKESDKKLASNLAQKKLRKESSTLIKLAKKIPFYEFFRSVIFKVLKVREILTPLVIWYKLKISKPIPIKDRPYYSRISQRKAIKNYKETPYEGDILYLRSGVLRGKNIGLTGWWEDFYLGFAELCNGSFEAHIVGGDHNDIFKISHARKLIKENMFKTHNGS